MHRALGTVLRRVGFGLVAPLLAAAAGEAREIGHYNPGVLNIRDYIVPDPGFYLASYNYYYTSERLNAGDGDELKSVTIGPGAGVTLGLDVNVDVYAWIPALIWVPEWQPLGARLGMMIAPTFANASVGASLASKSGRARDADTDHFDAGDLFVQPLWLSYSLPHWDFGMAFGFWAPVGKYDVEVATFPVIGPRTVEATDNIGYGFWTNQTQGALTWYPFDNKGTAVATALTYEHHFDKEDFDVRPGSNLTLNWGISQYLPLTSDQHSLLEVGPWGYSTWQVTHDRGSDATPGDVLDQAHAAGAQLGFTYVPWALALNGHYAYEFHTEDRFEGHVIGINVAIGFGRKPVAH